MLRIAALDDDKQWLDIEKEIIAEAFKKEEYELCSYMDINRFLSELERKQADIYLLDMKLSGKNGLEIGRIIKRRQESADIIYVTNYVEYAVEAYEVNAFRYIPKQLLKEKLPEACQMLYDKIKGQKEEYLVIAGCHHMEKLLKEQIYYIVKEKKVYCYNT